jgi:predicted metal-binding protein
MEGLPVNPDECPKFSPPADDWCEDGKIVTRGFDDNGCKLPPKCILGKEAIQERKKIHFEERTGQECPEGCRCQGVTTTCPLEDGGREMTVYARSGDIVFQTKGVRAVTTVALYHHNGFVYGVFKNNVTKKILLPDEVKEKISARLQKKLDKHDIELDEDGFYHVRAKKAARFLWLIPVKETVRFEIDAETGEMIKKRTSWWGFLAKDVEEEI